MYFGLLFVKSKVGVAESEKRVAAIFLLPVWPLELPGGSFLPYSGPHGCSIADSRFKMLPTTKSAASGLNMWPRSTIQKPEVLTNVPEMVRNVVKLTIIRKKCV